MLPLSPDGEMTLKRFPQLGLFRVTVGFFSQRPVMQNFDASFDDHEMSESFPCRLGVRQGECLSPFLFAMYVNDLESHLYSADGGVTISNFKSMLLLYADDLVIFAETPEAL